MIVTIICLAMLVTPLGVAFFSSASEPRELEVSGEAESHRMKAESVRALLDLIDTIVQQNPGYQHTRRELEESSGELRQQRLTELYHRNASDPMQMAKIEAFLQTEARQIYFRRFSNVTPDHFRRVFLALPYERISAPGDIATPYFELFGQTEKLRTLLDKLVEEIDLLRCRDIALRWLPAADYPIPEMYLVYDNNAGSFTAEGKAFYNLYAGEADLEILSTDASGVIAHELHHVLAEPYLKMSRRTHDRWQRDCMAMVIRSMVSEGAAIHCDPPQGFKLALWEDRDTVVQLMQELNHTLLALENGMCEESEFWAWYSSTFHEIPRKLLEDYASRTSGPTEVEKTVRAHLPQRPDLVHTLGWWMVSHVSQHGKDSSAVKALILNPYQLFSRYNETLAARDDSLRMNPLLISAFGDEN